MVAVWGHATRVPEDVAIAGPELYGLSVAGVVLNGSGVARGEVLTLSLDPDVLAGHHPLQLAVNQLQGGLIYLLGVGVEVEDVRAGAVEGQGCSHNISACHLVQVALGPDSEDRADGVVGVDDGGTVEGVEGNNVLSLIIEHGYICTFLREARVYEFGVLESLEYQRVSLHILIELHISELILRLYLIRRGIAQVLCYLFHCLEDALIHFSKVTFEVKDLKWGCILWGVRSITTIFVHLLLLIDCVLYL